MISDDILSFITLIIYLIVGVALLVLIIAMTVDMYKDRKELEEFTNRFYKER